MMLNTLKSQYKKGPLNVWKDQFEIPIFNYYEAFKDLERLLKKPSSKELNYANYDFLANKLMELQDWFAFEVDETSYKAAYKSISRLIRYKYTRHSLNMLLIGLKTYGVDTKTEWLMDEKTIKEFKSKLELLKIPFRIKMFDQISDIERRVKGLNNDIGMLEAKLKKNESDGDYNYMETVIQINKIMGFRIDPHKYTLHEWVNTLKMINKMPKPKK